MDISPLQSLVQHNCHISDARHARDYTMCIYLLKMREYFRWEMGYGLTDTLPSGNLGAWVEQRETHWQQLKEQEYNDLPVAQQSLDLYNAEAVNDYLLPLGYAYSAGLGRFLKPHFCLGKLAEQRRQHGFDILLIEQELARDLSAPPAMLREKTIYIRRDSLRRMLWERVEEWRWRKRPDDAMGRCVRCYDFDTDNATALEQMTDNEAEAAILHELGEGHAGEHLGDDWHPLLLDVAHSKVEIQARAVRDLIADCAVTLPQLLEGENEASLHFFFANFRAMRRGLFPELYAAYHRWAEHRQQDELRELAEHGLQHWKQVAEKMLEHPRREGDHLSALAEYVDQQILTEAKS